jgi:hypothetical protein
MLFWNPEKKGMAQGHNSRNFCDKTPKNGCCNTRHKFAFRPISLDSLPLV